MPVAAAYRDGYDRFTAGKIGTRAHGYSAQQKPAARQQIHRMLMVRMSGATLWEAYTEVKTLMDSSVMR